jgi:transposase-like protein
MKAKRSTRGRRVVTRYSAEDRERLIKEQAQSGETKAGFCRKRGINLGTFHGWPKHTQAVVRKPRFAEVETSSAWTQAAVEVLLPNGARIGIRHQGKREDLIAVVRGVAGC